MSTKSHSLAMAFAMFEREHGLAASSLLSPHKVSLKQMLIVSSLSHNGSLTVSELARLTLSDKSSTSRTLTGLEKIGWVKKVENSLDLRKSHVQLTLKGKNQGKLANEICESLSDTMEAALTATEQRLLINLLGKVVTSLIESRNS